jgi:putative FmdB family regulatory protein
MPEYRYRCNDCELLFDVEKDMEGNHDAAPCLDCDQPCERVWTTPAVVFRGAGFSLTTRTEETEPQTDELCDGIEGLKSVGTFVG